MPFFKAKIVHFVLWRGGGSYRKRICTGSDPYARKVNKGRG
jgi:hypothetical protein